MSQKREHREESFPFDGNRPRKLPSFKSVVVDAMNLHKLQQLAEPILEPLIRRIVKEEVDSALRKYSSNKKRIKEKSIRHSESRNLQFLNAISLPVFTGSRLEGKGCCTLSVALLDAHTREVVSNGPLSSSKVEIVVLEGDFDVDEGYNWSVEEFTNNLVREREGKKALLTGDVIVTLKDGIALVDDILFTDNSSWTRSRKFRLGARIIDSTGGSRIKEAISEPFVVRDHRGELYKKHHPPSLSDAVWRLKKIGKDGAFHQRLRKQRINTVQDFLILLWLDPSRLRNILGAGMPAKMWEIMVEHAQTCVLDKKVYVYNASRCQEKNHVVFNVVGQVMGMLSNGKYASADKLSESEKVDALELVNMAFRDRENVGTFDDESSLVTCGLSSSTSNIDQQTCPTLQLDESDHYQDLILQKIGTCAYSPQINLPSPDFMYYMDEDAFLHDHTEEMMRFDQDTDHSLIMETVGYSHSPAGYSDFEMSTDLDHAIRAFLPCSAGGIDHQVSKWWSILFSVLRWRFSIRRIMARRMHI